jgi:hypothetical protein
MFVLNEVGHVVKKYLFKKRLYFPEHLVWKRVASAMNHIEFVIST